MDVNRVLSGSRLLLTEEEKEYWHINTARVEGDCDNLNWDMRPTQLLDQVGFGWFYYESRGLFWAVVGAKKWSHNLRLTGHPQRKLDGKIPEYW